MIVMKKWRRERKQAMIEMIYEEDEGEMKNDDNVNSVKEDNMKKCVRNIIWKINDSSNIIEEDKKKIWRNEGRNNDMIKKEEGVKEQYKYMILYHYV